MKPLLTTLALLLAVAAMTGCQDHLSRFIINHKKPIIVKHTPYGQYEEKYMYDITLLSADGHVLYLDATTIVLPDTIK